jgi:lysophospholipase L1-like esterase
MGAPAVTARDRTAIWVLLLVVLGVGAQPVLARRVVVAFGDSITKGIDRFDEQALGGYPGRLGPMLRQHADFQDVEVINEGLGGETTSAGLSRINAVLNSVADDEVLSVIIMEGTNDVSNIDTGRSSIETTVRNLESMAAKVRDRGWEPLYSTIIPRKSSADRDGDNEVTFDLIVAIREQTSTGPRPTGEPWEEFFYTPSREQTIYYQGSDGVGHPNAAGFQLLAELFRDKLTGVDSIGPVFSGAEKTGDKNSINPGDSLLALLHESGSGINMGQTFFTIDGQQVPTNVAGSSRRAQLSATVPSGSLSATPQVRIQTEDLAGNARSIPVASFSSGGGGGGGGGGGKADVNGDGRVDGEDLVLVGLCFGTSSGDPRYSAACDLNNDGRVNNADLSILENNFGNSGG